MGHIIREKLLTSVLGGHGREEKAKTTKDSKILKTTKEGGRKRIRKEV